MKTQIEKLTSIASQGISGDLNIKEAASSNLFSSPLGKSLMQFLDIKNGFFAFESALHVYPFCRGVFPNLAEWNSETGWRAKYNNLSSDLIFFAQDIFGVQFCLSSAEVSTFDPETGELEQLANSLEEWADKILRDYDFLTGYSIARDWQKNNGPLGEAMRLVPKIPFVAGGAFDISNLYEMDCEQSLKFRAKLASQIRNLPDGALKLDIS